MSVCLPLKLSKFYTYSVPKEVFVSKGDVVLIPFKNKELYGIVLRKQETIDFDYSKLKSIISKIEHIPPLNEKLIDFLFWIAKYNISSFGNVLKMAINITGFNFESYDEIISINPKAIKQLRITKKRQILLDVLSEHQSLEKGLLISTANVSRSIINKLINDGYLQVTNHLKTLHIKQDIQYDSIELSADQQAINKELLEIVSKNEFMPTVLQGLPGSGKTEVYFEAINAVLQKGQQVLVLLPEISLSAQIFERFKKRFKATPYMWHSDIGVKGKQQAWISASDGNLKIVIGTRSALLLPFSNLGLIVIDEEHDNSYKQEEGVIYNARDMAVLKSKIEDIPIILSSATPSIETMNNVYSGKYKYLLLNERYNKSTFPDITTVDMKKEKLKQGSYISSVLQESMEKTLDLKEQVLLFINKRGYAGSILCTSCLEKITCKYCSASMVEHKSKNRLYCHYCGYSTAITKECPSCKSDKLVSLGVGVEKIYEEVKAKFPDKKVVIASSDTMASYKKSQALINQISNYEYDIIIGTQIISKGYNFPKLTLVGILDSDGMSALDLKATERAWQVLYQVAGRAGRYNLVGRVVLQTYLPKSDFIQSFIRKDYNMFVKNELRLREELSFPPFGKFVALIVSSKNINLLENFVNYLESIKPVASNLDVLGPTQAPLFLLRTFYRQRFLIQGSHPNINLQKIVQEWLQKVDIPSNIKIQIDVDPVSFF